MVFGLAILMIGVLALWGIFSLIRGIVRIFTDSRDIDRDNVKWPPEKRKRAPVMGQPAAGNARKFQNDGHETFQRHQKRFEQGAQQARDMAKQAYDLMIKHRPKP